MRPEDAVIADDVALDRWYEQFLREQARKAGRKTGDSKYDLLGRGDAEQIPKFKGGYK